MNETYFNKLVRDKVPTTIESNGEQAVVRTLNTDEYKRALLEKLVEEAKELLESNGSIDERADVGEVIAAYDEASGWSTADVQRARDHKNEARGAFVDRLYLEKTITP